MKRQLFLFSPDGDPGGSGERNEPEGSGEPQEGSGGPGDQSADLVPRSELQKVNSEAAKYRKELRDAQKKIEALEGQSKTELERERERADKAEKQVESERKRARDLRVQVIASKVGIVKEARADAARLLDWDRVSDPDDDASVEEALRELVKDRTFLLGNVPGGADGGTGGGRETSAQDMNALLRQAAGRGVT